MEARTGNAESGDAGTSAVTDASGGAEATAPETTNDSDATATAPDAPVASASEATSAPDRTDGEGTPPVAEPASGEVSGALKSDSDRKNDEVCDAPRVLSPTSKWRVLRTRVRAMSFVERVGKMAAHARPSKLQARAAQRLATRGAADATASSATRRLFFRPAVFVATKTVPLPDAPTATFTFTGALDVPDAELDEDVQIERVLLRACLFHGGEFVGDVVSVPATRWKNAEGVAAWRFGSELPTKKALTVADVMASGGGDLGQADEHPEAGGVGYHLLARTDRKGLRATAGGTSVTSTSESTSDEQKNRDDVELLVELNVVPARGESNGENENENENENGSAWFGAPPASFLRKPPMVSKRTPDEICVAWGRVPWPDETTVGGGEKTVRVDVPLRGGALVDTKKSYANASGSAVPDDPEGIALPSSDRAKKSSKRFFAKFTKKGKLLASGPSVSVVVAPPPPKHAAVIKKLPRETLCASRFVPLLATFSDLLLREREANASKRSDDSRNTGPTGVPCSSNPALTTIPACLRDEHLADALADAWRRARSRRNVYTKETDDSTELDSCVKENVEILESLSLKFWPLLRTGALRDARVDALASGDVKARRRRAGVIEKSVAQHPRESLSRHPDGWNHEPFSVAELRHVFQ